MNERLLKKRNKTLKGTKVNNDPLQDPRKRTWNERLKKLWTAPVLELFYWRIIWKKSTMPIRSQMNKVPLAFHPYFYHYKKLWKSTCVQCCRPATIGRQLMHWNCLNLHPCCKVSINIYTSNKETNKYLIFTAATWSINTTWCSNMGTLPFLPVVIFKFW